jgi:hypothetical protein
MMTGKQRACTRSVCTELIFVSKPVFHEEIDACLEKWIGRDKALEYKLRENKKQRRVR